MKSIKQPKRPNPTGPKPHLAFRFRVLGRVDAYGVGYLRRSNGEIKRTTMRIVDVKRMERR